MRDPLAEVRKNKLIEGLDTVGEGMGPTLGEPKREQGEAKSLERRRGPTTRDDSIHKGG